MRIAMVSEHASPLAVLGGVDAGGQNVHVAELARVLGSRGHEVVVHTRRDDPGLPARVPFAPGVEVHHVDAGPPAPLPKDALLGHMPAFGDELTAAWRADRPDVVHAHFWMSGLAALQAASRLGLPVVQTFHALGIVKRRHQGERDTSPPERLALERRILTQARHVIATCSDEVFELLRLGADRARLSIVPCGADLQRFRPEGPVAARDPALRHRLLVVGRLVQRKGVGNVVSALADLRDAELVVVGGPAPGRIAGDAEAQRLLALAADAGVADRVHLLGRRDREGVAALMRSADLLVSVPWYEPFGIVPVEAMATGLPVVASAVGGMIDTVVDGVTGLLVPPRDPERLHDAVATLLAEPARRASMGTEGVRRARRLFDWERIATATAGVYDQVAERPRTRRFSRGPRIPAVSEHVDQLRTALGDLADELATAERLGRRLAEVLQGGGRLLAVGNGGSAAQAQHLTAELVGRFVADRRPLSAICLHGDTSSLTAIANDFGADAAFARQVEAHARPGDVLVALSTSGESANVLAAADAARAANAEVWALTGAGPNALADLADEAVCLPAPTTATVQELHLVAIHALCAAVDRAVASVPPRALGRLVAR